jgi:hypothetical protein
LVRTVFTEEDKRILKTIAGELIELSKLVEELTETLVNVSDKRLLEMFDSNQDNLNESKLLSYKETLEKQVDNAEKEFRS